MIWGIVFLLAGGSMVSFALVGRHRERRARQAREDMRCQFCGNLKGRCPEWCPYVPRHASEYDAWAKPVPGSLDPPSVDR